MSHHVVFDCMIYLQAAARPERVHECFQTVQTHRLVLCISPEILAEIQDVLTRPKLRRKFPALTPEAVNLFLADVLRKAQNVAIVPPVYSLPRDPKDEKYVNLALAVNARFLVTRDKDLLDLMVPSTPTGQDFQQRFPNLKIVEPLAFVQEVSRQPGPETAE